MTLPEKPTAEDVEDHFRDLLDEWEIVQPDEVEHDLAAGELRFRWYEQKLVIVIELSEDGPGDVRSAAAGPPLRE